MSDDNSYLKAKIVILGEPSVGKTSIAQQFVNRTFKNQYVVTIAASYLTRKLRRKDKRIHFQIWDTAGQEQYKSLAPLYYSEAQGAILVYDITKPETFKGIKYWRDQLKENIGKNIPIVIAGNKCDLVDREAVDPNSVKKYAAKIGAFFQHTSAKENTGIDEIFNFLGDEVEIQTERKKSIMLKLQNENNRSGCC